MLSEDIPSRQLEVEDDEDEEEDDDDDEDAISRKQKP